MRKLISRVAPALVLTAAGAMSFAPSAQAQTGQFQYPVANAPASFVHILHEASGTYVDYELHLNIKHTLPSDVATIRLYGCNNVVIDSEVVGTAPGEDKIKIGVVAPHVPANVFGSNPRVTVTLPDASGAEVTHDVSPDLTAELVEEGVTCSAPSAPVTPSSYVKKWSSKAAHEKKAKAGKKAGVTATTLSKKGKKAKATVTYQWTIDGRVSRQGAKYLTYKPSTKQVGHHLVLNVLVTKSGDQSRVKKIDFGAVRG